MPFSPDVRCTDDSFCNSAQDNVPKLSQKTDAQQQHCLHNRSTLISLKKNNMSQLAERCFRCSEAEQPLNVNKALERSRELRYCPRFPLVGVTLGQTLSQANTQSSCSWTLCVF